MKGKLLVVGGLVAALAVAPVSSAYAWRDHDRWHGGPIFWPFAAAAAVVVGAATLATLPFRAVAAATYPGPYYYAPPPPAYYPPPQGYYPPPGYYAPPPAYYPPPPGYAPYDK